MIKDLDLTLKKLLSSEAEPGTELASANINFCVPDAKWQGTGTSLDLNVYLYEIKENRSLRNNEKFKQRDPDGTITQKQSPPRLDCAYLLTAWNKSTSTVGEEKELQEHRLLSQVLQVLMRNPAIPSAYLQGSLATQQPPLPLVAAQSDGLPDPVKFWSSLGSPFRPSINCVITLSLDLKQKWISSKMVITKQTIYELMGTGHKIAEYQIGGRILKAADPTVGLDGAKITILELAKETSSDPNGYYTFLGLSDGDFTFKVTKQGYKTKQVTMKIPAPQDSNYDIKLSV